MDPGKCHILGFLKLVRYQVSLTTRLTVNIAKFAKFQKFLESENIVISSENKIVNYVNEKTFWLVYVVRWVRSLMLVGRCQWPWNLFKMLSMASSKSWIQTNRIHSVHDGIKIQLSMPDFDWSRKIQIISDEVDAFKE